MRSDIIWAPLEMKLQQVEAQCLVELIPEYYHYKKREESLSQLENSP
jgi:hypothetical protein